MMGGFFPPSRKLVHGGPTNRVQRWPNTNRPLVNIGIVFRTGSIDDRSEASRMMVDILAENNEAARGWVEGVFGA